MDKRKLNWITMSFVVLMVLVIGLMLRNTLRRSSHITLPDTGSETEQSLTGPELDEALSVVEIEPETVQAAIATLSRPESYQRIISVEHLWSSGSGGYQAVVSACEGWTRTDRTMPDGQVRHSVTNGEKTYIWYNHETDVYEAPAGEITADHEQMIPTYEEILELPTETIAASDYRTVSGIPCIYVETTEADDGYTIRYWVSVESGLLVASEKLLNGGAVYRMGAPEVNQTEPDAALFVLPDGRNLL